MKSLILGLSLFAIATPVLADEFHDFLSLKEELQKKLGLCRDAEDGPPCPDPKGYDIQLVVPRACGGELTLDNIWIVRNDIKRSKRQAEKRVDGVPCAGLDAWLEGATKER